jgi:hypothetical protein
MVGVLAPELARRSSWNERIVSRLSKNRVYYNPDFLVYVYIRALVIVSLTRRGEKTCVTRSVLQTNFDGGVARSGLHKNFDSHPAPGGT